MKAAERCLTMKSLPGEVYEQETTGRYRQLQRAVFRPWLAIGQQGCANGSFNWFMAGLLAVSLAPLFMHG